MTQLALPSEVSNTEIARERSFGDAIKLCVKAAGLGPKQVQADCRFDKGQFSRWESGAEGIVWPRLVALMDHCGNDAPVLWLLHNRGYDLSSVRKTETETEKALRLAQDENRPCAALCRRCSDG
jgi:hypothetical protein